MRTNVKVNKNERSWAIELISQINAFVERNDLIIKRAGGECTISSDSRSRMFPDVILYRDKDLNTLVQGWELKMPDVPITDEVFIADAQRKAIALGLNSCVIWNFSFVKLFVLNTENGLFENVKTWTHRHIKTREDVAIYQREWTVTLKEVVLTVNEYLFHQRFTTISIQDIISINAVDILINENKTIVSDNLKQAAIRNGLVEAEISEWWNGVKHEYSFDEKDSYNAYAKNLILNWTYRILFAHLIKRYQNVAYRIDALDYNSTPKEANEIFRAITERCDFYNVFSPLSMSELMPNDTWKSLMELSLFLKANGINKLDQEMLQNVLEHCVNSTRRELNGQFTTPQILAEILVRITVRDWTEYSYDPCCGTGTIAKEILRLKIEKIGVDKAIESTWASDKYKVPLQIANISMTSSDSMNKANRLFQKNALSLSYGNMVSIVDPSNGQEIIYAIPLFGSICSNLPFVSFESIPIDDRNFIERNSQYKLDGKSDLSYSIALHLSNMLKEDGYMGIVISNSWLGTKSGDIFFRELKKKFDIRQVHISGKGRWFANADVVATILILQKSTKRAENKTAFYIWNKSLDELKVNHTYKEKLINTVLLNRIEDNEVIKVCKYEQAEIEELRSMGLSYNSLFHDVKWVLDIKGILCPINKLFNVIRGSRRGWDKLFFPENHANIEEPFLIPALFNGRNVNALIAHPDRVGFCCSKRLDELATSFPNAYRHIKKFESETNNVGRPLPEVLQRPNEEWYEMKPNEISDIFTLMNPDDRIFFGRFQAPSFINQRLIGFKTKNEKIDVELCHALMNTVVMKFFIEAVGFGRGLGVLDINKKNVASCHLLNPQFLSDQAIENIKSEFRKICEKPIVTIVEELQDEDWRRYNMTVLEAFQISSHYDQIVGSLMSLRSVRKTARKVYSIASDLLKKDAFSKYEDNIYTDYDDRLVAEI